MTDPDRPEGKLADRGELLIRQIALEVDKLHPAAFDQLLLDHLRVGHQCLPYFRGDSGQVRIVDEGRIGVAEWDLAADGERDVPARASREDAPGLARNGDDPPLLPHRPLDDPRVRAVNQQDRPSAKPHHPQDQQTENHLVPPPTRRTGDRGLRIADCLFQGFSSRKAPGPRSDAGRGVRRNRYE